MTIDWTKIIPEAYIYLAFGAVLTALLALVRFGMKKAIQALKTEWNTAMERLERIESVQGVQAENHLNTIQQNTAVLPAIQKDISELVGYLKAKAEDGKI